MKNPIIAFHVACIMLGQADIQIQHCCVVASLNNKEFKSYDEYFAHCNTNGITSVSVIAWNMYLDPIYF